MILGDGVRRGYSLLRRTRGEVTVGQRFSDGSGSGMVIRQGSMPAIHPGSSPTWPLVDEVSVAPTHVTALPASRLNCAVTAAAVVVPNAPPRACIDIAAP